jgi:hypothetical protein
MRRLLSALWFAWISLERRFSYQPQNKALDQFYSPRSFILIFWLILRAPLRSLAFFGVK